VIDTCSTCDATATRHWPRRTGHPR